MKFAFTASLIAMCAIAGYYDDEGIYHPNQAMVEAQAAENAALAAAEAETETETRFQVEDAQAYIDKTQARI